jgi:hypothetical protein
MTTTITRRAALAAPVTLPLLPVSASRIGYDATREWRTQWRRRRNYGR